MLTFCVIFFEPGLLLGTLVQDEINRQYKRTSALQMMCWMNFWCGLYYLPVLFLATSVGWDLLAFCSRHPQVGEGVGTSCP